MKVAMLGPIGVDALAERLGGAPVPALRHSVNRSVTQLVAPLLDRGHDVTVVTLDRAVTDEVALDGDGLRVRIGPYRPRHRARDGFKAERDFVTGAVQRERPDVVHAHWTYEYALGGLATGLPTLVTVRDWAPTILRYDRTPYRAVRLLMAARTLQRGRHFSAVSPYMQERVQRWARTGVALVPNAVADELFDPAPRRLTDDGPVLVAANRGFGRRKNVPALLRAFPHVRAAVPGCTLRLAGAGYGPGEAAQRWAAQASLDDGVEFLGRVPPAEMPRLLAAADVFVHPALEESFGMVLVEAMAQGLPVVGGRASGAVPWVLDDGRAGVLCDVTSPTAIAGAVTGLLADPVRWRGCSEAGFRRADATFRLSGVIDAYDALYEEIG